MRYLTLIIILLLFTSCNREPMKLFYKTKVTNEQINSRILKKSDFTIPVTNTPDGNIKIRYLGCGGYYIGDDENAVLIDPFFSHFPMLRVYFGKVFTRQGDVAYALDPIRNDLKNKVRGVFAAHAHYDHLMDIPYVYNRYLDTSDPDLKVYGSGSAGILISNVIQPNDFGNLDPMRSNQNNVGNWVELAGGAIRVLPIETNHAPHFAGILFFHGDGKKPLKGYTSDLAKTKGRKWKVGNVFAFLVDFMDGNDVRYRIFVQSSAAKQPGGYLHQDHLNEKAIDLAILGAASFSKVKDEDYPEKLMDYLGKPQRVIIGHWEDFFKPYQEFPKTVVPSTKLDKFILKLNSKVPWLDNGVEQFYLPEPGVEMRVGWK